MRRMFAVGALFALLVGSGVEAAGPLQPRFNLGDRWTVKTVHRGLQLGRGKEGPTEKTPESTTYWMYKVTRVKVVDGDVYYVVSVKDKDGRVPAAASLIFCRMQARKDGKGASALSRLALVKGKFLGRRAGESVRSEKTFGERPDVLPVLGDMSSIPHDFPIFPVGAVKLPDEAGALVEQTTYEITEGEEGGLRFARDIRQSVRTCPDPKSLGGTELARWFAAEEIDPKDCLLVELERPFDGMRVRQIWNEKTPWPLWSESPWSTSRLVIYSSTSRMRGPDGPVREGRLKEREGPKGPPLDERGRPPSPAVRGYDG